jgi:hypothetical protein
MATAEVPAAAGTKPDAAEPVLPVLGNADPELLAAEAELEVLGAIGVEIGPGPVLGAVKVLTLLEPPEAVVLAEFDALAEEEELVDEEAVLGGPALKLLLVNGVSPTRVKSGV